MKSGSHLLMLDFFFPGDALQGLYCNCLQFLLVFKGVFPSENKAHAVCLKFLCQNQIMFFAFLLENKTNQQSAVTAAL